MKNIEYLKIEGTEGYKVNKTIGGNASRHNIDSNKILAEVKGKISVGERKTIERDDKKWNLTMDEYSVIYMILSDLNYPNRLIYKMIEEISNVVKKMIDGSVTDRSSTTEIQQIVNNYDDPSSIDKLSRANQKVDEVKVKLNENIQQLVNNQQDLEVSARC